MAPLVSVIIAAYNAADHLPDAIESVLEQTYSPVEIVVADDGSEDNTGKVLAAYGSAVKTLQLNHGGPGAARNAAISESQGDLIAVLDADDVWYPEKIQRQVAAIQQSSATLCHTGSVVFGDERGDGPIVHDVRQRIQGRCFEAEFERNGIVHSTVLMQAEAIPASGYPEDLPAAQDYGLLLQILTKGEAVYIDDTLLKYRRHTGQITVGKGQRTQVYSAMARLRALELGSQHIDQATLVRLRQWTLEELDRVAYSHYWNRRYADADRAFSLLEKNGRVIKKRHRRIAQLLKRFFR